MGRDRTAAVSLGQTFNYSCSTDASSPDCDLQAWAQAPPVAEHSKTRRYKCWFSAIQRRPPWATVRPMPSMTGGAPFGLLQYAGHARPE